jgi:group I intron endonuclease
MSDKISGIYCIENMINGKRYIGQSQDVKRRMKEYHSGCIALIRAIEVYGIENFSTYIVEEVSAEELNQKEIFYIKEMKSHTREWGYNMSFGGSAPMRGRFHSEDTKNKYSADRKGDKNVNYGKPMRESHKKAISETRIKNGTAKMENNPVFNKKYENSSSIYHGVNITKNGTWTVRVRTPEGRVFLGTFKNEIDGAMAHDDYVIKHNLPNKRNF